VNSTVRSRWTNDDEARLQELVERKRRIVEQNSEPIKVLASTFGLEGFGVSDVGVLVRWMIENADAIRDALEPFDSGVRAK
jgi:hypothetical protein